MLLPVLFTLKPFVFGPAGLPWLMCLQGKQRPTYGSGIQVCLVRADLERVENRQQSFHQVSEQQVFKEKQRSSIHSASAILHISSYFSLCNDECTLVMSPSLNGKTLSGKGNDFLHSLQIVNVVLPF